MHIIIINYESVMMLQENALSTSAHLTQVVKLHVQFRNLFLNFLRIDCATCETKLLDLHDIFHPPK